VSITCYTVPGYGSALCVERMDVLGGRVVIAVASELRRSYRTSRVNKELHAVRLARNHISHHVSSMSRAVAPGGVSQLSQTPNGDNRLSDRWINTCCYRWTAGSAPWESGSCYVRRKTTFSQTVNVAVFADDTITGLRGRGMRRRAFCDCYHWSRSPSEQHFR